MKEQAFEMKNFGSEVQNFVGSIAIDEKLAKEREDLVSLMNHIQIFNLELEHKPKIDIYNEPNSFWDINIIHS
jgi:aspartate 1-decarboxylase